MSREKLYLGIGLVIGIVLSALFFQLLAPRYATVESGDTLIRQDRWSGESWRFVDKHWKRIMSPSRDWQEIDQNLMEALHIPTGGVDRANALSLLKEKYGALKDVSNDELLERIKLVYSKEILCNLYLGNFLKLEEGTRSEKLKEKRTEK